MRIRRTVNAIITGSILAAFVFGGISFFRPIPVLEAGICGTAPVGYYRLRLDDFEMTEPAGTEAVIGAARGNTFAMLDYLLFGHPICAGQT